MVGMGEHDELENRNLRDLSGVPEPLSWARPGIVPFSADVRRRVLREVGWFNNRRASENAGRRAVGRLGLFSDSLRIILTIKPKAGQWE